MPGAQNPAGTSRVAIFIPSLAGGGAERVMGILASALGRRGVAVDLVLVETKGPFLRDIDKSVTVVDLRSKRVLKSLWPLVRYLRRTRPAAILSALSHANVIALVATRLAGVGARVVVSERAHFSSSSRSFTGLIGRMLPLAMRHTYVWADGIIGISHGVAVDLARELSLQVPAIEVVYNPVPLEAIQAQSLEPIADPISGGSVVILAAGRLVAQKDFATLIRAFARMVATQTNQLVILGQGPLLHDLQALADDLGVGDRVTFPGFVGNPYSWMRRADLFVLSSTYEGFGNVLVEAMACGTPVVSTDCPSGPSEILEGGKWGRLVPVGDVDALAEAMTQALGETDHPDVESRAAAFSVDAAVEGYARVLGVAL